MPAEYKITTREELILALQEASNLEHSLLLQYLYAAFSMKQSEAEGLCRDEVELVRGWKLDLLRVARDEMGHLGTVLNMLMAIGASPSLQRPPFPQPANKWFPITFELAAFSADTIQRFIRFESPEPVVKKFAVHAPELPEYEFVGQLYRSIRSGFITLETSIANLLVGRPGAQDSDTWGLNFAPRPISRVSDAVAAVDALVLQGEGTPDGSDPSAHYATFSRIANELNVATRKNRNFIAGRNVVTNPVLRPIFNGPKNITIINEALPSFSLCAIVSSFYILLLQALQIYYDPVPKEAAFRESLQRLCIQLMTFAIRPLGELLTMLPATTNPHGPMAGASFELYGDISLSADPSSQWTLMHERLTSAIADVRGLVDMNLPELQQLRDFIPYIDAMAVTFGEIKKEVNA